MRTPTRRLPRLLLGTTAFALVMVGLSACQPNTKSWDATQLATYTYSGTQAGTIQIKLAAGATRVMVRVDGVEPRDCWDTNGTVVACRVGGDSTYSEVITLSASTFKSVIGVHPGETFSVGPPCCATSGQVTVRVVDGDGNLTGDLR